MQALILANGKGTNLRPLTVYTPKPIIPVINTPLLLYQIEILKRAGVKQITLFLDYQPGKIEDRLGSEEELGVELRYVVEPQPLGNAGAYKFISKYSSETAIVLNGDILTDLVISRLLKQHIKAKSSMTIATVPIEPDCKYGILKINEKHVISNYTSCFDEKPADHDNYLMDSGIYIVEPQVAELISPEPLLSFERDIFPQMVDQNYDLHAFPINGDYWCAINSPAKYLQVHKNFMEGKIRKFKIENGNRFESATSAYIDEQSVIGSDCVIKPNVRIINSVLGKGVKVEEQSVIENSVVWSRTHISDSVSVKNAILASSCYVGKNSTVSSGSVLGDKASLPDYSKV